jgi:cysteine-rich repeat protein
VFFENTGNASAPAFVEPAANRFAFPTEFGTNGLTGGAAFVDLDDDADLDLVIGSFSGNLAYFENTGTAQAPAFAEPVTNPFGLSDAGDSAQPAFGDLDDDGDLDALVRGFPGTGVFFENTGTASAPAFAPGIPDTFGFGGYNLSPSLVDVDADEDLDAFFTGIVFFENTGTSSVPAFGPYVGDPFGLSPPQLSFPAPAFGDLDGDGDLDVLAGDVNYASSGEIYFFENSGAADAPAFADPATNPFGLVDEIPGSPALADLDGDDDLDLFLRNGLRTFFYENRPESDPVCGNHLLEEGEQCDDGNLVDGDGCSAECSEEPLLCPAQPAQGCHGFAKAVLRVDERKPGREKLIAKLLGGPTLTQGNFGNPLMTGGTAMGVCVYDASGDPAAALEVERAGESCAGGDCWKPLVATPPAGVGFSYKDKAAAAHGVRKLSLRGGPAGRSRILCTAGNRTSQGQSGLPIGIAAALAQTTAVTVQLHTSDADCFSATLDQIQVQRSNLFKAK